MTEEEIKKELDTQLTGIIRKSESVELEYFGGKLTDEEYSNQVWRLVGMLGDLYDKLSDQA